MAKRLPLVIAGAILVSVGYLAGTRTTDPVHADVRNDVQQGTTYPRQAIEATIPKGYGRLVAAIPDRIGTGLIFEDSEGIIRFVSLTGMKEGELVRYDKTPTHGGIPKSYGHLVAAVVGPNGTGLVFEDSSGVIRLLSITGVKEAELTRQ